MIIAISGKAGSGKSTIAKAISKGLRLKHYSMGDLMRGVAKDKGMTLLELSKLAESDESIDKELDKKQIELGKNEDNFVIDGRLTAFFLPNSDFKIFLDCSDEERARRILEAKRDDEKSKDISEMIKQINKREDSERIRYKKYYGVDYLDPLLYDVLIDTTDLDIEEAVKAVLDVVSKQKPL